MSQPPSPSPAATELDRLQRELTEKTELVQHVRKELIQAQITVLELQDTILQRETDRADAISILGQVELVLESKIDYIFELDRVLNEKIAGLQRELAMAHTAHAEDRAARDQIAQDLVGKLDAANRALAAAHALAATHAREASELRERLQIATQQESDLRAERDAAKRLAASRADAITRIQGEFAASEATRRALEHELTAIRQSLAWKVTAPLRAISRRKP